MVDKNNEIQKDTRRLPRQARSLYKVELMLEAALQLLEQGEIGALTTNAVAAKAGVSIGTLYQYFGDKQALLDALVARELGDMSKGVVNAMQDVPAAPGDRIRGVFKAVVGAYGGRGAVHRKLIEHALTHHTGGRLSPLYENLQHAFTSAGVPGQGEDRIRLSEAQAFVLTHAIAGVLRTLAATTNPPALQDVEDALVVLAINYVAAIHKAALAARAS